MPVQQIVSVAHAPRKAIIAITVLLTVYGILLWLIAITVIDLKKEIKKVPNSAIIHTPVSNLDGCVRESIPLTLCINELP
jgi:hypothetical protein